MYKCEKINWMKNWYSSHLFMPVKNVCEGYCYKFICRQTTLTDFKCTQQDQELFQNLSIYMYTLSCDCNYRYLCVWNPRTLFSQQRSLKRRQAFQTKSKSLEKSKAVICETPRTSSSPPLRDPRLRQDVLEQASNSLGNYLVA